MPRLADGSLPINGFLRLLAASGLVNAAEDVGLPYSNGAPDIGAFEVGIPLPGDANLDAMVDIDDLRILAANWQSTGAIWTDGDFDFDGAVTVLDLGFVASNWQAGVNGPGAMAFEEALIELVGGAIPEPSWVAIVPLLCGALVRRRGTGRAPSLCRSSSTLGASIGRGAKVVSTGNAQVVGKSASAPRLQA
jgi:hypothetical protein